MSSSRAIGRVDEKNYTQDKENCASTAQTLEHFGRCIKCALDFIHFADEILCEFWAELSILKNNASDSVVKNTSIFNIKTMRCCGNLCFTYLVYPDHRDHEVVR
jgi:hypothetical protein